jgi:hypothetical protein
MDWEEDRLQIERGLMKISTVFSKFIFENIFDILLELDFEDEYNHLNNRLCQNELSYEMCTYTLLLEVYRNSINNSNFISQIYRVFRERGFFHENMYREFCIREDLIFFLC